MIVGIDPGLNGAIVFLGERPSQYRMPRIGPDFNANGIAALLGTEIAPTVVLEAAQHVRLGPRGIMPKPTSVLYRCQGIVEGVCAAIGVPLILVPPRKWQAAMLGKTEKGKTKDAARLAAGRLWPNERLPEWAIDAALIAEYGRRTLNQAAAPNQTQEPA